MSLSIYAKIEGLLFGAAQPLVAEKIAEILEIGLDDLKNHLGELQEAYAHDDRGIVLTLVAGGYQLRTKKELKETVAKLFERKAPRLTAAMLETLSIVAYKQPVTRPEIDRVRGVDSSGALKTLLERELIEMRGRSDSVGNPVIYATTPKFLEWFQISSLGDLPPLSEIEALQNVGEEGSEKLMELLDKDDGFQQEDLRDLDENLLEISRDQRKIKLETESSGQSDTDEENGVAIGAGEESSAS